MWIILDQLPRNILTPFALRIRVHICVALPFPVHSVRVIGRDARVGNSRRRDNARPFALKGERERERERERVQ